MTVPIQEIMDTIAFVICLCAGMVGFQIYPLLWIIPATAFVYWYLFLSIISDGITGFSEGPCRYDIYVHKKNKWVKF